MSDSYDMPDGDKWDYIVVVNDESDPVEALVIPLDRSAGEQPKYYRDYRSHIETIGERQMNDAYSNETYEQFAGWLVDELFKPMALRIEAEVRWIHDTDSPYVVILDVRTGTRVVPL